MEKQDLILLKEKLNKLNEKEKDLRDIYLKKISNGDILGPMTGYPSIDKPALAFYDDKYITAQMPNMTATEFLKKMNEKNMNLPAIDCSDGIITYQDLFEMIDKTAKSLYQIGAKKGKIIVGMLHLIRLMKYIYCMGRVLLEVQYHLQYQIHLLILYALQ